MEIGLTHMNPLYCVVSRIICLAQHEVTAQGVFDLVIDALFLIDVVLNFLTAYTARGVYVTNLSMIAYHYLTTWFLLDICGSVPFDKIFTWISSAEPGEQSDGTNDVLKALRMIRILKLVRAVRFLIKLNELEQKDTTGTLKGIVSVSASAYLARIARAVCHQTCRRA
jgi:hypothetical protein